MACIGDPKDAYIHLTQLSVDVVRLPSGPNMRVSEMVVEVLRLPVINFDPDGVTNNPNSTKEMRVTQMVIELPKGTFVVNPDVSQLYEA